MAKLTEAEKIYIVQQFAMFASPADVARGLRERFDRVVESRDLRRYNPDHGHRCDMGKQLRAVFDETRKAFMEETIKQPAASRAYRIKRLAEAADDLMGRKNYMAAAKLYEQIAKETGGGYSNTMMFKGDVAHKHRVDPEGPSLSDMTLEEKRNVLADTLKGAILRAAPQNAPTTDKTQ